MGELAQEALGLAKRGLHVFPCYGVVDGACACGRADCSSPAKHPRTARGLLEATTDPATIKRWWRTWPTANVGIACGPSRLVVIDVDPRHEGTDTLAGLERDHGALPDTPRALTGSYNGSGRGTHFYFRAPDGVEVPSGAHVLGPGVDLRAQGGYIIVPPSAHLSGVSYEWDAGSPSTIAALPEWIVAVVAKTKAPPVSTGNGAGKIRAGGRNASLTSIAGSMRRQGLGPDAILQALRSANASCDPPLAERELATIARSVGRYDAAKPEGGDDDAVVLSTVEAEHVDWLWVGRIPYGRLTLLDGDPGLGKSTVALDIAARLTTGRPMPGESGAHEPAGVVLIAPEDGLSDTVRPRFDAAGGDASRVAAFRRLVTLPDDVPAIESAAARVGAKLVIVDPLMAALGKATDSYRDQDCRRALGPLALLAERLGAAVVIIRHLNKSEGTDPMRRGGGSVGILGAARSALLLAKDPDGDDDERVLAAYKSNLGRPAAALRMRLAGTDGAVRVVWGASVDLEPSELLAAPAEHHGSSRREATEWLTSQLKDGPRLAKELATEAAREGHAWRTVKRARAEMDIEVRKQIGTGQWVWQLKSARPSPPLTPSGPLVPLVMDAKKVPPRARSDVASMAQQVGAPAEREPGDEGDADPWQDEIRV